MAWRLFPSMWPLCNSDLAQSAERQKETAGSDSAQEPARLDPHVAPEQRRSRPA